MNNLRPLSVDLDHSLIRTDLIQEAIFSVIRKKPWHFITLLLLFMTSIKKFKFFLVENYSIDVEHLPYNQKLIKFLKEEKSKNRHLILITGSPDPWAKLINNHLHLFDEVIGTTESTNMVGVNKVEYLNKKYGTKGYDYVGDSFKDRVIWKNSESRILASPSNYFLNFLNFDFKIFDSSSKLMSVIKALRPHQWSKNLLVFIPMLTAHQFSIELLKILFITFVCFSFAASSGYILNDLFDLQSDRRHRSKKFRPLPSGHLTLIEGLFIGLILFFASLYLAFSVDIKVELLVAIYFFTSIFYSFKLKEIMVLDTLLLASLYTFRIIVGGVATQIELSSWLILFSIFFFLGLANLKRSIELQSSTHQRRGYQIDDLNLLFNFGIISGFCSLLVLSFYIYQDKTQILYKTPYYLWGIVMALLYWIMRLWILAKRGLVHDDPVTFALKDKVTWGLILVVLFTMYLAL